MKLTEKSCSHCFGTIHKGALFCSTCGRSRLIGVKKWELIGLGAILTIVLAGLGVSSSLLLVQTNTPNITSSPVFHQFTTTSSLSVTEIASVASTETFLPTEVVTKTLVPIPEMINSKDDAILKFIPSGEFLMGSNPSVDPFFWGAESPPHKVVLEDYYIYETEVTNQMYEICVNEKACPRPVMTNSRTRQIYYGNVAFENYPVIFVSWVLAVSYCKWAGGRLPTEAEWEKAARGIDERLFPWGNDISDISYYYCGKGCANDTYPVGQFVNGRSPYGVLDMAGNVWEWVNDYFNAGYYNNSPLENPLGPASGGRRVIRGGGWHNPPEGVRVVARASLVPDESLDTLGFRCVIDNP